MAESPASCCQDKFNRFIESPIFDLKVEIHIALNHNRLEIRHRSLNNLYNISHRISFLSSGKEIRDKENVFTDFEKPFRFNDWKGRN